MKTKNKIQASILNGMFKLASASFFIAILFSSCSKDEIAPSSNNSERSDASAMRVIEAVPVIHSEDFVSLPMMKMTHIGRGKVQSYEVMVFNNGLVHLKAISNVPFKGTIKFNVSAKIVNAIRESFLRNGFERLEREYPRSNRFATTVIAFASCADCDASALHIKTVTDHSVMVPRALVTIQANVVQLLNLEKRLHIPIGTASESEVDGTASN